MSEDGDKDYEPDKVEMELSTSDELNTDEEKPSQRKNKSYLWKYFDRLIESKMGVCRLCSTPLSYATTSANLKQHLIRKHPRCVEIVTVDGEQKINVVEPSMRKEEKDGISDRNLVQQLREIQKSRSKGRHPGRRRPSALWLIFTKLNQFEARCSVCHLKLRYISTVFNLKAHLRRKHPKHYKQFLEYQEKYDNDFRVKTEEVVLTDADKDEDKLTNATEEPCTCGEEQDPGSHMEGCPQAQTKSWDYYDKITIETAICKVCDKAVPWNSILSVLQNHLAEEHPSAVFNDKVSDEVEIETDALENPHEVLVEECTMNFSDEEENFQPKKRKIEFKVKNKPNDLPTDKELWHESFDRFGAYVASLMKMLPKATADKFQVQIIERLLKEKMKYE